MSTTSPEPTVRSTRSTPAGVVGNPSPTTLITTAILTGGANSSASSLRVAPEELASFAQHRTREPGDAIARFPGSSLLEVALSLLLRPLLLHLFTQPRRREI